MNECVIGMLDKSRRAYEATLTLPSAEQEIIKYKELTTLIGATFILARNNGGTPEEELKDMVKKYLIDWLYEKQPPSRYNKSEKECLDSAKAEKAADASL